MYVCSRKAPRVLCYERFSHSSNHCLKKDFLVTKWIYSASFSVRSTINCDNKNTTLTTGLLILLMAWQLLVWQALLIFRDFMITLCHTENTISRTPLDVCSAQRRDLYPTTYTLTKRQISVLPVGFELAIPASELSQTHALDRSVNGIGRLLVPKVIILVTVAN
jgi:hypothetical protein